MSTFSTHKCACVRAYTHHIHNREGRGDMCLSPIGILYSLFTFCKYLQVQVTAQWYSTCLACVRFWIHILAPNPKPHSLKKCGDNIYYLNTLRMPFGGIKRTTLLCHLQPPTGPFPLYVTPSPLCIIHMSPSPAAGSRSQIPPQECNDRRFFI